MCVSDTVGSGRSFGGKLVEPSGGEARKVVIFEATVRWTFSAFKSVWL